jgi:hypothetical protein
LDEKPVDEILIARQVGFGKFKKNRFKKINDSLPQVKLSAFTLFIQIKSGNHLQSEN